MPISVQSQKSMPLGAVGAAGSAQHAACGLKWRSSISHRVIGRNASAARHAGDDQALVERALDVAGAERTAKVPMIEAMIETPPMHQRVDADGADVRRTSGRRAASRRPR